MLCSGGVRDKMDGSKLGKWASMKLGTLDIQGNTWLAPMAGVTDWAFRCVCQALGAAVTVTEMVSSRALVYRDKKSMSLLRKTDGGVCGAQIFGNEPSVMGEAAAFALELSGADFLDINMGCPMPKIVNNGDGSALMRDPERAARIVEAVVKAVSVPVTVKNTGSVAGKDVVQLYASAPYTLGGIEKAHKVLVGFAKTKLLQPGESETVTVSFDPYSASSYDYRDANSNGFSGYELEAGEYTLYVSRNAHESEKAIALNLAADVQIGTDPTTDSEVVNRYTDSEDFLDSDWQLDAMLSRADWEGTWPTPQTAQQHAGTDRLYEEIRSEEHNNPTDFDSEEYPWFGEEPTLTLRDLLPSAEAEGYEPVVSYDD